MPKSRLSKDKPNFKKDECKECGFTEFTNMTDMCLRAPKAISM